MGFGIWDLGFAFQKLRCMKSNRFSFPVRVGGKNNAIRFFGQVFEFSPPFLPVFRYDVGWSKVVLDIHAEGGFG